jgi:hypothetical protein
MDIAVLSREVAIFAEFSRYGHLCQFEPQNGIRTTRIRAEEILEVSSNPLRKEMP